MLGTLLMGKYMHRIGREQTIMIGMIFNLVQQAGLYWTLGLHDANIFLFLSFVFQMIGGLGSGMNSVATLAIIVSTSKDSEREMNIGMIEMATGIGFLIGPMWGSLMYQMGGFTLPFGSMGKLFRLNQRCSDCLLACVPDCCVQHVPGQVVET